MADLGDLRIPVAMRPTAEQVIKLTDKVSGDLLDEEYATHLQPRPLRSQTLRWVIRQNQPTHHS